PCSLTAHARILTTCITYVIGMIILMSNGPVEKSPNLPERPPKNTCDHRYPRRRTHQKAAKTDRFRNRRPLVPKLRAWPASLASAVYNVCRETRYSAASVVFLSPALTRLRISAICTRVSDGFRPLYTPAFFARAI